MRTSGFFIALAILVLAGITHADQPAETLTESIDSGQNDVIQINLDNTISSSSNISDNIHESQDKKILITEKDNDVNDNDQQEANSNLVITAENPEDKADFEQIIQNSNSASLEQLCQQLQSIQGMIEEKKVKVQLLSQLRSQDNLHQLDEEFKRTKSNNQKNNDLKDSAFDLSSQNSKENDHLYEPSSEYHQKQFTDSTIDPQYEAFNSRVSHKFTINLPHLANKLIALKFIQSFPQKREDGSNLSSHLIMSVTSESINLFDITGKPVIEQYYPGHGIEYVAVSQTTQLEDTFIATVSNSDKTIRLLRIENESYDNPIFSMNKTNMIADQGQNQRLYKTATLPSIILSSSLQDDETVGAIEYVNMRGQNKYFIIASSFGNLHIFHKNGTFVAKETASDNDPIIQLAKVSQSVLFLTQNGQVGVFNLNGAVSGSSTTSSFICKTPSQNQVKLLAIDTYQGNIFYGISKTNNLLVFEYKMIEEQCKIKHSISLNGDANDEEIDYSVDELEEDENDKCSVSQIAVIKGALVLSMEDKNLQNKKDNRQQLPKLRVFNTTELLQFGKLNESFEFPLQDIAQSDKLTYKQAEKIDNKDKNGDTSSTTVPEIRNDKNNKFNLQEQNQPYSISHLTQQRLYTANYLAFIISTSKHNDSQQGNGLNNSENDQYVSSQLTLLEIHYSNNTNENDMLSQIRLPLVITLIGGIIAYQIWKGYQNKARYVKNNRNTLPDYLTANSKTINSNRTKVKDNTMSQINQRKIIDQLGEEEEEYQDYQENEKMNLNKPVKKQEKISKEGFMDSDSDEDSFLKRQMRIETTD